MSDIISQLSADVDAELAGLEAAADPAAVDAVRVRLLGRKGIVTSAMKGLGQLSAEERPAFGKAVNGIKNRVSAALDARLLALEEGGTGTAAALDHSEPGRRRRRGHSHPITQVTNDCVEIFRRMGFIVADGPDIENEFNNFDALNTPSDHPSRDTQDTFYLPDGRLLRTHTSPVQVRTMLSQEPPVRVIAHGCAYRRDTPDATHGMIFPQIEGLYVDEKVSLADLKGVLLTFARECFGPDVKVRLRPHFFPFTEPSIECDFSCINCGGNGCKVCKQSGWLEIAGAGLVDPKVFEAVGYDPERWTGYAFGMGIGRIAMLKFAIPDIRLLYDNNLRLLHQF